MQPNTSPLSQSPRRKREISRWIGGFLVALGAVAALPAMADPSTSFMVSGVERPASFDINALRSLPVATQSIFFHTGHGAVRGTFTGVPLWTLLERVGIANDPKVRNDRVRKYLVVKGSDGYLAVVALAELDPEFGGQQALVAYEQDGKPLDQSAGFARLIMPGDKGGGRDVLNLVAIELRSAEAPQ